MRKKGKEPESVYILRMIDPGDKERDGSDLVGVYRSLQRAKQEAWNLEYDLANYEAEELLWRKTAAATWKTYPEHDPSPLDAHYRVDKQRLR